MAGFLTLTLAAALVLLLADGGAAATGPCAGLPLVAGPSVKEFKHKAKEIRWCIMKYHKKFGMTFESGTSLTPSSCVRMKGHFKSFIHDLQMCLRGPPTTTTIPTTTPPPTTTTTTTTPPPTTMTIPTTTTTTPPPTTMTIPTTTTTTPPPTTMTIPTTTPPPTTMTIPTTTTTTPPPTTMTIPTTTTTTPPPTTRRTKPPRPVTAGKPRDCQDVYYRNYQREQVAVLYPDGVTPVKVKCMYSQTVILNRLTISSGFNRTFQDYADGFGDPAGDYYIGNEAIHALTSSRKYSLLITMKMQKDMSVKQGVYRKFRVASRDDKYKIHVGGYGGDVGDALRRLSGTSFATTDMVLDPVVRFFVDRDGGGFWYSRNPKLNRAHVTSSGFPRRGQLMWMKKTLNSVRFSLVRSTK